MVSIITAVYNQRDINRLFWDSLARYTKERFELIIIDNGSTDGSPEFFESVGARVIYNKGNYSYPHCQNQGIATARYEWLAFLNNDVVVSPDWNSRMIENMQINGIDAATACGIEHLQDRMSTRRLKNRWKICKLPILVFGPSLINLNLAHRLMYGNWLDFCNRRYDAFRHKAKEGFVGNTIMMKRSVIDKIGLWDERIQGADYDLFLRSKKRSIEYGDMKPVHICLDVFVHHYVRITVNAKPPSFVDRDSLIPLEEKWSKEDLRLLDGMDD